MQDETATQAFALSPPSASTQQYVASIRSILQHGGRSTTLSDLKSKFEDSIPEGCRFEVLLEIALPCWAKASACGQDPHIVGRTREASSSWGDVQAAEDSLTCILADALAFAVLAEEFHHSETEHSGNLPGAFQDSIIALKAGIAGSQRSSSARYAFETVLHRDERNYDALLRFSALEVIRLLLGRTTEAGKTAAASTLNTGLNAEVQLLDDAAHRSLSMGELRRAREAVQVLPKSLLPTGSTISRIAQRSSVLGFEVLCRAADLCSPDELIHYLSELRFLPANMRTFDLLLRLLRIEGGSPGQERLASVVRPYMLAPFLEFALNRSTQEDQSGQSEEEGRQVKLTCQFLTSLLDASLLTPVLSQAAFEEGQDAKSIDDQIAEAHGLKEGMLLLMQEFALIHSRFREASELYARVVRM